MGDVPTSSPVARPDRGSALLAGVVAVALAATLVVGVASVAVRAVEATRAQAAADAAALAGVTGGWFDAARVAVANDAELVSLRAVGDDIVVVVELGGVRRTARASGGRRRARPRAPPVFSILASWESPTTSGVPIRVAPGCGRQGAVDG
jgi:hypothetical protein